MPGVLPSRSLWLKLAANRLRKDEALSTTARYGREDVLFDRASPIPPNVAVSDQSRSVTTSGEMLFCTSR